MDPTNELQSSAEEQTTEAPATEERPPIKIDDGEVMVADRATERRDRQQAAQAPKSDLPKADAGMFKTQQPVGRVRNRSRVDMCKAWIESFDQQCRATAADATKRSLATNGLYTVFTSLDTLNALDTKEILNHLSNTIMRSNTGAWERRIVFANLKFLPESKRELLNRMLQLMTQYAELENKSKIREKIDPSYAISLYKDVETRGNLDAFFPRIK